MAEHSTRNPDHPKTEIRLEQGETIAVCRCMHSKTMPFCDGTHNNHPGKGPCIIHAPKKP